MDLKNLSTTAKANSGAKMVVIHPGTGKPLLDEATKQPVAITLLGRDSDTYKSLVHDEANTRLEVAAKTNGRSLKITAQEIESRELDLLVACTVGWDSVGLNGDALEFTPDNARRLYTEVPCVYDQAKRFIEDRANYLGN